MGKHVPKQHCSKKMVNRSCVKRTNGLKLQYDLQHQKEFCFVLSHTLSHRLLSDRFYNFHRHVPKWHKIIIKKKPSTHTQSISSMTLPVSTADHSHPGFSSLPLEAVQCNQAWQAAERWCFGTAAYNLPFQGLHASGHCAKTRIQT